MRKPLMGLFAVIFLAGLMWSSTEAAVSYSQRIILAGATVDVTVYYNERHGYTVRTTFHIEQGSPLTIGCLFLNKDFRYVLQDRAGNTIPINRAALAVADSPHTTNSIQPYRTCEQERPNENALISHLTRGMRLAPLYPNLPAGVYSLYITFAPHGILEERNLLPVQLVVDRAHPL